MNHDNEVCNPFFSILIPAYNVEKSISKCIDSIANQKFRDIEIIVVDDGSTDHTRQIIADYCKRDLRIKCISNEHNSSLYASRKLAMQKAIGKYVILLDGDDYAESNSLGVLFKELKHNPVDILEFSYIQEPTKKVIKPRSYGDDRVKGLLTGMLSRTVWNKCYSIEVIRKALIEMHDFYCNMGEDGYYSLVLYNNAKSYCMIKKALVHYCLSGGMSTTIITSEQVCRNIESLKQMEKEVYEYVDSYCRQHYELVRGFIDKSYIYMAIQIRFQAIGIEERFAMLQCIDMAAGLDEKKKFEQYLVNIETKELKRRRRLLNRIMRKLIIGKKRGKV